MRVMPAINEASISLSSAQLPLVGPNSRISHVESRVALWHL